MSSTATARAWISCNCSDARRRSPPRVPPVPRSTNGANGEEVEPAPRGLLELNPEAPLQAQWAGSMRNASSRFFCRQPLSGTSMRGGSGRGHGAALRRAVFRYGQVEDSRSIRRSCDCSRCRAIRGVAQYGASWYARRFRSRLRAQYAVAIPARCLSRLLGEQPNRLKLLAAGKRNARFQPVPRSRHEARRRKLVVASPDQLYLLCGTLGSDNSQCSGDVLGRKRLPFFVVNVDVDCSLLHDEFDHNRVVPPAHDSSVLRRVVAVCVGIPEN